MDKSDEEEGMGESIREGVDIFALAPPIDPTVRGLLTPLLLAGTLGLKPTPEPL
jgi:hypothetical protein